MLENLAELYTHAGEWGDPILIATAALFLAGWVMLFTVRMVKRFVLYSVVALVLPNAVGIVGYVESIEDFEETVLERAEDLSGSAGDTMEDFSTSPLYLGLIGSFLTLIPGLLGLMRSRKGQQDHRRENSSS